MFAVAFVVGNAFNTGLIVVDSYSFDNYSTTVVLGYSFPSSAWDADSGEAQSFLGDGSSISSITFYLRKAVNALPTGSVYASIWSHTGTFGVDGEPDSQLVISEPVLAEFLATQAQGYQPVVFSFNETQQIVLEDGTPYCVVLYSKGFINKTNGIQVAGGAPTGQAGTYSRFRGDTWDFVDVAGDEILDLIFSVEGVEASTTPDSNTTPSDDDYSEDNDPVNVGDDIPPETPEPSEGSDESESLNISPTVIVLSVTFLCLAGVFLLRQKGM